MVRNVQATTATGLRKNRVTQKTRLRVVRGQLDVDAIVLDDEEERNRVLASQGVDAEDANEHHLQAVLHAASHPRPLGESSGKNPEAHIPTPDAAGLVEAYDSLYPPGKYNPPTTHLRFSETVEETVEGGLAGAFTYFLDERDAEWIDKNNQEARGEGTSASANGSANGAAEDPAVTSTRSGRALHSRGARAKGKEPEQSQSNYSRVVVDEDEFELVMGLFEKLTEDKFPFIHLAPDALPPFSDYEGVFAMPLPPATFASYMVPLTVPHPERLVHIARTMYPHWKERKLEREGKRVVPQLDYDDAHESSYICFRRRDAKPVRRTRASSTAYTDKLARLRVELQMGVELARMVLDREELKKEAASAAGEVWQARCKLVEDWRSAEGASGAAIDEGLLFDRERVAKPPAPRVILGLNRRPSGAQSGAGTPIGDPHSPLTAHLDLSSVNLSALSPLAYVAVQSAPRERHRDVQAGVEREMASLRARDTWWEDIVDMSYQAMPSSYPDKLFKPFPPPSPALASSPPSFGIDPAATLLSGNKASSTRELDPEHPPAPLNESPLPSAPVADNTFSEDFNSAHIPLSKHPHISSLRPERVPRSLRPRTGRGGRLHLDRRLHVHRAHPLTSLEDAKWPSAFTSSAPRRDRQRDEDEDEAERWGRRDWHPEHEVREGKGKKSRIGEDYWARESVYEDRGVALGKRKRADEDEGEVIGFEQSGYGLRMTAFSEWEKGPPDDEERWRPEPRSRGEGADNVKTSEPPRAPWCVDGRTTEEVERAWRVEERWRYDSETRREDEDRFLLDDFQPKFIRTMVTLLDAKDHETVKTDPLRLDPSPIPYTDPQPVHFSARAVESRPMKVQRATQPMQPAPLVSTPQPPQLPIASTTPPPPVPAPLPQPVSIPQQRMDEQIRRMARQSLAEPIIPAGTQQTSQRISVPQQPPSTPTPISSQVNSSPLKQPTFGNGLVGDGGATARISAPVRPKSHTPSPQQQQQHQQHQHHATNGMAVNGFTGSGAFAAHPNPNPSQNQNHLALHPSHEHGAGLNPQQYATLRNVFAERVPGSQQLPLGRTQMAMQMQMQMNGVSGNANVNLQMGPGSLNLKLPPARAAQFRMNGAPGDVNGSGMGGAAGSAHVTPPRPNGNGSPVPHPRTPSANGHLMTPNHGRVSPHMLGRASPLGHAALSSSPHHHSNLVPLHASPPQRPTPTLPHQQVVGGPGQGHGYS